MISLQRFDQCRSAHAVSDAYAEGAMFAQHRLSTSQTASVTVNLDASSLYLNPVLTPFAFDPTHSFPHISNLSLNLAVGGRGTSLLSWATAQNKAIIKFWGIIQPASSR